MDKKYKRDLDKVVQTLRWFQNEHPNENILIKTNETNIKTEVKYIGFTYSFDNLLVIDAETLE